MPSTFHPLPLISLSAATRLHRSTTAAQLDDPALSQMTDLRQGPCVVADHLDGLDETLHVMLRAQVHMAFVAGVGGEIIGMVGREDLQGEKPVQRALADHVHHEELALDHVMAPTTAWQVVTYSQLAHTRLGDLVATLREHGLRYLVVVDGQGQGVTLRGVFSARRLEAALGVSLLADLHSRNFAELEATLASR